MFVAEDKTPGAQASQSFYIRREISPGVTQHRFFRGSNWDQHWPKGTPQHAVFLQMRDHGVYSLVEVKQAQTSVVGSSDGSAVFNPVANLNQWPPNSLLINFGFFVHYPYLFKASEDGMPLNAFGKGYPIGENSATPNFLPVSKGYSDLYQRRTMTDGTYATVGPSLHLPLTTPHPKHHERNLLKGRFSYFAEDAEGNRLPCPIFRSMQQLDSSLNNLVSLSQSPSTGEITATPLIPNSTLSIKCELEGFQNLTKKVLPHPDGTFTLATSGLAHFAPFIRTVWAHVPGSLSHVNEPNERNAVTQHPDGTLLSHTYTSRRRDGLQVNQQRELLIEGARFLGRSFDEVEQGKAYGLDGGPSILQAYLDGDRNLSVLSNGGLESVEQEYPLQVGKLHIREVSTVMVVRSGML